MKRYNDCMEVREEFSAYLDGEMSAEERERLEAHLAGCADCLREMDVLKRVDVAYRGLAPVGAPADFEEGVREAVRTGRISGAGGRGHIPRWMGPLVAMASAAAVLIVGVLVLESREAGGPTLQMASAPREIDEMESKQDGAALMKSKEAEPAKAEANAVAGGGAWDNFAQTPERGNSTWEQFAQPAPSSARSAVGGREDGGESLAQDLASGDALDKDAALSAAAAPVASADEEMRARAELIGTPPPAETSGMAVEKLFDAPTDLKTEASPTPASPESSAPAQAGEVMSRQKLRSFRVLAGGLWVEEGYDHEATTKLKRSSRELRELMKQYPQAEWDKLLERSARQVFQMGEVWYDLEAATEETP